MFEDGNNYDQILEFDIFCGHDYEYMNPPEDPEDVEEWCRYFNKDFAEEVQMYFMEKLRIDENGNPLPEPTEEEKEAER